MICNRYSIIFFFKLHGDPRKLHLLSRRQRQMCIRNSLREAPEYYRKLEEYMAAHGLAVSGFSREITMIDYGFTEDTSQFVTEIQIPQ